ncbi:MAG: alpha/beta fold hydrolase [Pseudomonadales bacterium]
MTTIQDWQRQGERLLFAGHEIFCRDSGVNSGDEDAPVLLLIHGFPTASWDWHELWEPLCVTHRVMTLDMLGFGLSDKPKRFCYSIMKQADLCESFLRDRDVSHYHILAHDYGDTVAQELLARQQCNVAAASIESICFLNGGLFPETHHPVLIQRLLLSPLGPLLAKQFAFKRFVTQFNNVCAREIAQEDLQSLWSLICHKEGLVVMPKLIRYMVERKELRERWVGALTASNIPMRLIDGLLDPVSGAHMVSRYRELVPNANVVELVDVGHYPQLEAPNDVLAAAFDFWRQL